MPTRAETDMRRATQRIMMGRVAGIYGVRGWLKVMSYTKPRENILNYAPWQLKIKDSWREVFLLERKIHNKGLVVAFKGVADRDSAREFVGADIAVMRTQLQELPKGEYYQVDLLDMQVINQDRKNLGRVTKILETGANDVLVIEGEGRHLIPLVLPTYVREIDQEAGVIKVDWEELD